MSLTDAQRKAAQAISENRTTLLEGGSRSGKTYLALSVLVKRASQQQSNHLIARFRFNHAKQSICFQTMPEVLRSLSAEKAVRLNKTDWFYEFTNGSTIWIGGLDDKERTEKILGNEYSTVFLNEASQISYEAYETIVTRVNPSKGMKGRVIVDYNPPSIHHWGYKMFHGRKFPDGRDIPGDDFAVVRMNPKDNPHLPDEYLNALSLLSINKRKRFLDGEYTTDNGSLWQRSWIQYAQAPDMERIVIGVDPGGTVGGDDTGIIVVGKAAGVYYVLDDCTVNATPSGWSKEIAAAVERWRADAVVAEKNYGGDMVEHTIRTHNPDIRVKMVSATRGKVVRAEPISALYEQGGVLHASPLPELEDELCMYDPETSKSPNRMDALVWACTELMGRNGGVSTPDYSASSIGV